MKRQIIQIDEEKCNGCGVCIPDCPEGALQIIDGKARLVSDLFCDGLGACIGTCPEGAISTIEREADAYDEIIVMREHIVPKGMNTIKAHLKHLKDHNEVEYYKQAIEVLKEEGIDVPEDKAATSVPHACPGTLAKSIEKEKGSCEAGDAPSELTQWPIELHLLSPDAHYFKGADLLVAADCTAFSYGNFHRDFLKGKKLIMFCPKLDNSSDAYIEKMTAILERNDINSITIARMEVPCCGGTEMIINEAIARSGVDVPVTVKVISIAGEIM